MRMVQSCGKVSVACILICEERDFRTFIQLAMSICLSLYSKLLNEKLIIDRSCIGRVSNMMYFKILTSFWGTVIQKSSLRMFWKHQSSNQRAGKFRLAVVPFVTKVFLQLCGGVLPAGCQKLYMMMEGVIMFLGFYDWSGKLFLDLFKDVCMVVQRCRIEELYYGILAGIFVSFREEVSSYVGLYKWRGL